MNEKGKNLDRVEFYSGASRDEKPVAMVINGQRISISRVIREEKIGSSIPEGGYHRTFVVEIEDGSCWEIREEPANPCGWSGQCIQK